MQSVIERVSANKTYYICGIIGTIILIILYSYTFINPDILYRDGEMVSKRLVFLTIMYASAVVLLWIKNNFSNRINLIISIGWFCITPFVCYFLLECMQGGWSALIADGYHFSVETHIFNVIIYAFLLGLLFLIIGSFKISGIITYAAFVVLGLAMYYVVIFRGTGLIILDFISFGTAMEVAGEYDYNIGFYTYFGLSLGVFGIVAWLKTKDVFKPNLKQRAVMWIAAILWCCAFLLMYFKWDRIDDNYIVHLYRPQMSQRSFGTAMSFVRSGDYIITKKPEGYSVEAAQEIADRYKADGDKANDTVSGETPNLIVVMNETFADLQDLGSNTFKTNKEVMPFVDSMKENTQKGDLYVSKIGSGTAIMEFEMLTGNTNAFLPEGTIAYQTMIDEPTASLASYLKKRGYQGMISSHPNKGTNYNRVEAYPLIGFDEFYDIETFYTYDYLEYVGPNISDKTSFKHIIDQYEAAKKESDKPFFEFQVTMQNHSPYGEIEDREIKITDEDYYYDRAELYMNYVHKTDIALEEFIGYFEKVEEPTLIVFFGDHTPAMSDAYYDSLMGVEAGKTATTMDEMRMRKTPLIIWANYDIEEKEIGDISLNYVSGLVMDNLGLEQSGYQKFLQELRKDVPVINSMGYWGADGNYYDVWNEESPYYKKVWEYNVLEYNNLVDTDNRIEGFFD